MIWPFNKKTKIWDTPSVHAIAKILDDANAKKIKLGKYSPFTPFNYDGYGNREDKHNIREFVNVYFEDYGVGWIGPLMNAIENLNLRSDEEIVFFGGIDDGLEVPLIDFSTKELSGVYYVLEKIGGDWTIIESGNSFHAIGHNLYSRMANNVPMYMALNYNFIEFNKQLTNHQEIDQNYVKYNIKTNESCIRITNNTQSNWCLKKGKLIHCGEFIQELAKFKAFSVR